MKRNTKLEYEEQNHRMTLYRCPCKSDEYFFPILISVGTKLFSSRFYNKRRISR